MVEQLTTVSKHNQPQPTVNPLAATVEGNPSSLQHDLWNSSRPQTNPGLNQGLKQKEEAQPIFLNLRSNPEKIDQQYSVLPHHFSTCLHLLGVYGGSKWSRYLAFWCFTSHPPTPIQPPLPPLSCQVFGPFLALL